MQYYVTELIAITNAFANSRDNPTNHMGRVRRGMAAMERLCSTGGDYIDFVFMVDFCNPLYCSSSKMHLLYCIE